MESVIEISELPGLNAGLNGAAAFLLAAGYAAIRAKRRTLHKGLMLAAFGTSMVFLTSYLIYHFHQPTTPYEGEGISRVIYFEVQISHVALSMAVPPLALITVYRALRGRLERHRAIARWTLPIWLYVSVTGVVVYVMLYRL